MFRLALLCAVVLVVYPAISKLNEGDLDEFGAHWQRNKYREGLKFIEGEVGDDPVEDDSPVEDDDPVEDDSPVEDGGFDERLENWKDRLADKIKDRDGFIRGIVRNFTVTRRIKEQILNLASADEAFDLFFDSYQGSGRPIFQEDQKALRKQIFAKAFTAIKKHNKKFLSGLTKYKTTVNAFSIMDAAEKELYLGFVPENQNISEVLRNKRSPPDEDEENATEEVLSWRAEGYLNEPSDQGICMSCWTYPAAALVEFALKTTSGTLPRLSTQQLLDCTYEHVDEGKWSYRNTCVTGGSVFQALEYLKMSQHSTTDSSYGYVGQDNLCQLNSNHPNEIQAKIRIDGSRKVARTAGAFIEQLKISPIAVGIVLESSQGDDIYGYDQGMYDGCQINYTPQSSRGLLKHAMLLTGYGPDFWELRNSWGVDWGDQGFMKWYRDGGQLDNMCLMMRWGYTLLFTDITDDDTTTEQITTPKLTTPERERTTFTTPIITTQHTTLKLTTPKLTTTKLTTTKLTTTKLTTTKLTTPKLTTPKHTTPNPTTTAPITTTENDSGGSTDDCWIQNTAGHQTTLIKRTRFTSYHDCIDACRARENCKMVSVSSQRHHDRYCLLLKSHSQTRSKHGWKSAKKSCFRTKSHVGPAECTDNSAYASSCPGWAGSGYCESRSYKDWMTLHCSKSCQFCEDDGGGSGPMKCFDVSADCGHWASIGYCNDDDFKMFMKNSCPKTCGACIG